MKLRIIALISLAIVSSCKLEEKPIVQNELKTIDIRSLPQENFDSHFERYKISDNKFIGKDSLKISLYQNGKIKSRGNFAVNREGNISALKIGKFEAFFQNGKLKERGQYDIGRYSQCCAEGSVSYTHLTLPTKA